MSDALVRSIATDEGGPIVAVTRAVLLAALLAFVVSRACFGDKGASSSSTGASSSAQRRPDPNTPYTAAQVATHDSEDDLWVVIDGKVYDLTEYVDEHPGGGEAIAKNAGKDVTVGFNGPQHPSRVFDIVEDYRVGTLVAPG
jgi:cytochrome b involved in lipid metabolism